MNDNREATIKRICEACGNDRSRMMDIVRAVQQEFGCVDSAALDQIADQVDSHRVEVQSVVSFYAFLSEQKQGAAVVRVCDDIIDRMHGGELVAQAFKDELGIAFGQTTADGTVTLERTPCIGICDQAPAALINDEVITNLTPEDAREIAQALKAGSAPASLAHTLGEGNNGHVLVHSMVMNNIRREGDVIFAAMEPGTALRKAVAMKPAAVIAEVKAARLRGRGGAGFPTGMKWEFTRGADAGPRYVLCNADEGEPGTFKDRVILTERPDLLFEGMTIAGYAIGADTGIVYLRGEYAYLRRWLEHVLQNRRESRLLGNNVGGKRGFHFDIRIQMGVGAYVCGEETALISSCEGLRGDPKNRPPFPAQKGYLGCPTVVNNVETFCCAARILDRGPDWFAQMGSGHSSGTKLFSVSGDCQNPGVYELPFGIQLGELLAMCGAHDAAAVQIGGPSGSMIGPSGFGRSLCFDDLTGGGAIMIFGPQRNVLEVAACFMDFFIEESCGYCTPCRVGNVLLKERLDRILAGNGEEADLTYLEELGETIKLASRCGLGQTSPNPVLSTLKNFRAVYEGLLKQETEGMQLSFDIKAALSEGERLRAAGGTQT